MKDVVIKGLIIKRELWILLGSVILALLLNVYSIAKFNTEWSELYTTFHITLLFGLVIYLIIGIIRLIIRGVSSLIALRKNKS